jgi:hypothetical protein
LERKKETGRKKEARGEMQGLEVDKKKKEEKRETDGA